MSILNQKINSVKILVKLHFFRQITGKTCEINITELMYLPLLTGFLKRFLNYKVKYIKYLVITVH